MTVLSFTAGCRDCGGALAEVNAGHTDGCRTTWVGACRRCSNQFAIVADITPIRSRGTGGHR